MATIYVDLANGNDSNDGSLGSPVLSVAKACQLAGNNGTIRCVGSQTVALGSASISQDATSFTLPTGLSVSAGDYIRPAPSSYAAANPSAPWCPAYRVQSYTSGSGATVLYHAFRGAGGTYSWEKIPIIALPAGQVQGNYTGQTFDFGWRNNGGTPVQDGVTATSGNFQNWTFGYPCLCNFGGRLLVLGADVSQIGLQVDADVRGAGMVEVSGFTTGSGNLRVTGHLRLDGFMSSYGARSAYAYGGRLEIIAGAVIHNASTYALFGSSGGGVEAAELWASKNLNDAAASSGLCLVGVLHSRISTYHGNVNSEASVVAIGYLDTADTPAFTGSTGRIFIGGPSSKWSVRSPRGVVDLVTGRSGSGYGLRFTPTTGSQDPLCWPFCTLAAAGKTPTLKLYTYWTGNAGNPPTAYLVLKEPNGLVVGAYPIALPASPGSSWTDAVQETIALAGTTLQAGSLQGEIAVYPGSDGAAVLYVDDLTWTNAGDQGDTSGLDHMGLVPLVQKVAAGGGLPFPLGL